MRLHRRAFVGSALALAACNRTADAQTAPITIPPLKSVAPFPVGAAIQAVHLQDPTLVRLLTEQVSQLTPEWEMKMEYIAQPDGSFRFDGPDQIAAFAKANGIRLFGHTLVWYDQAPAAFEKLDESRVSFAAAYRNYILAVVGRYRGQAVGWDVINETVLDDGSGWRDSLWARKLGKLEHMILAFQHAREADPSAVLFLNDFFLETLPNKRRAYLKLAETLLKAGAPLGGLGTQTHLAAGDQKGLIKAAIADLASLGLPIHISEMDVSLQEGGGRTERLTRQADLYREAAEAFSALPQHQQFAFTTWGLRDRESWRKREDAADAPLLFDINGDPKPAARAWVQGLG
ncbi:endo-1,4-beta-xylanase [Phenylobacterium sp. 20VBR1]|uniref:Beta-xylanase n=1 Tax=Phenylobacterium glaciei TaxID=2803784 RepID=A0A941HVB7_9CAUL|nr:endo-1,4-beta-xylanase [Phenylobacterium glaciei]MBR7618931.1 endo-1,4-beta-xylanase [Phenylobacterium glaciei]